MTYILCSFGEGYPKSDPQVYKLEDLIVSEDYNLDPHQVVELCRLEVGETYTLHEITYINYFKRLPDDFLESSRTKLFKLPGKKYYHLSSKGECNAEP